MKLVTLLEKFGKAFGLLFAVWLIGWLEFSFAWILLGLIVYVIRLDHVAEKQIKLEQKRAVAENEKLAITSALKYLPSWVYFPDRERAEWLNRILKQMWPYLDEYLKKMIRETVEPSIVKSLPDFLKSFRFERVDLGSVPFRIASVKVYDKNTSREEIIVDLDFNYAGNCDIIVRVKGLKAGIKDLQVNGTLRMELRPLIKDVPIVGAVSVYFLTDPTIEFNLTNLADILDIPGISDILRKAISEQLANFLVLPNKVTVKLSHSVPSKLLKFSEPRGIVRLSLLEGKNLKKADIGMLGMGKSDPYANITIGEETFKTQVVKNTINPKWNSTCEAIVHNIYGQAIKLEIMDEDQGSKDDFLGRAELKLDTISNQGKLDEWIKLEETTSGVIKFKATWLTLSKDISDIEPQIAASHEIIKSYNKAKRVSEEQDGQAPLGSVALVSVYLDSVENIPCLRGNEPDTFGVLSIGNQVMKSKIKSENCNPVWEETFHFLVGNPRVEHDLKIQVKEEKNENELGYVQFCLKDLLELSNMEIDEPKPLQGKAKGATLHATVRIRILKEGIVPKTGLDSVEEDEDENANENKKSANSNGPPIDSTGIPSLEDMVYATVKPIIKISGDDADILLDKTIDGRPAYSGESEKDPRPDNVPGNRDEQSEFPKLQVTLTRLEKQRTLCLDVHRAINLPLDGDKKPDVYARVIMVPNKTKDSQRRTAVRRHTTDPVFSETFEFSLDECPDLTAFEVLICTAHKSTLSRMFSGKKEIGRSIVDIKDLGQSNEVSQWYDIVTKEA